MSANTLYKLNTWFSYASVYLPYLKQGPFVVTWYILVFGSVTSSFIHAKNKILRAA